MVGGSRVYLERVVSKPAMALPGGPKPIYPKELKRRGVEGRVDFRFVVDTAGAIEIATMQAISPSHPEFADAVRDALVVRRFSPAERGGKRVRMWTALAFEFTLGR